MTDVRPCRGARDVSEFKEGAGPDGGLYSVGRHGKKDGSRASPATKWTGNELGVLLNNLCPKSQNSTENNQKEWGAS
jgi:hypothetical protein